MSRPILVVALLLLAIVLTPLASANAQSMCIPRPDGRPRMLCVEAERNPYTGQFCLITNGDPPAPYTWEGSTTCIPTALKVGP